ncbi:MAG TPA: Flp pilus assembly protein CpaB [Polyangia bacterium]|jgi:pilus assembly protein CpaB|nr:Flp pilus assembly protein CpaB [Polyangia bacterium]
MGGVSRVRRASDSGSRRSGVRAAMFWVVAIVAGLGAALLITRYLERRTVTVSTPTAQIVVAAVDLPLATKLRIEHLKLTDWPIGGLPPGALRDPKDAVDRIITSRVLEGEPISSGKLAAKDAGNGLAALIPANMRAIAVRVDDVVGVAGFIHPDDRVDVIVTIRPTRPAEAEPTSKVILQNVKVLAVGKEMDVSDRNRNTANPVTVATLLVNPEESEKLALSASEGKLLLTLRSWTDTQAVATEGVYPSGLLADTNTKPREVVQAVVAPVERERERRPSHGRDRSREERAPVTAAASARKDVVEILRGDRFEERKFEAKDKN